MTMQTPAPLPRLSLNTTSRAVSWLYDVLGSDEFDVNQPYQRGDVWGLTRRRNLVRSLIMGVPIPSLVINDRGNAYFHHEGYEAGERDQAYAIIDGKQRATTYAMFGADQISIPASWLPAEDVESVEDTSDGPYVRRSGLTTPGRLRCDRLQVGISQGRFQTLAEEQFIFEMVNYGGVPQGASDEDLAAPAS